jgi:putative membrane protein
MNRPKLHTAILITSALLCSEALAQTQPYSGPHGPMGVWGWGWGGMIIGPLLMLLFLAAAVAVVVIVVRWLGAPHAGPVTPQARDKSALEILEERYAKGEIDTEEFATRKRTLVE